MKKYLFIALAAIGFAACVEKIDDNAPHNGEVEESFIAINLMSADLDTRAATDEYGYDNGTEAERAIKSAYFFFFKENGDAFNVTTSAPGGEKNHLQLTIEETTGADVVTLNASDIKKAVLVLNTYKGVYPSQIVAVLNWTPTEKTYSLTELHEELATLGNDEYGYVMTNSVYMDGAGEIVDAVPVTPSNIKTSAEDALAAPIDIYVERIAAKVVLTATGKVEGSTDNIFDTQKNSTPIVLSGPSSDIDVYVKLHGWELYNDYNNSTLLKNINPSWDVTALGLTWNDIPYYRCYWAQSQSEDPEDSFSWKYEDNNFPTAYGFNVDGYTYCGENTNDEDLRTKVILKGQLMQKNENDTYSPLELARWYGTEYAGRVALKTAVANSLKFTLFYSADGESFHGITPDDLECVAGTANAEAYEVVFQLSTTGRAKTWYQYSSANGYVVFGDNGIDGDNFTKTNAHLSTVEPALLYAEGQTYYYVDIEHLGTAGAKYGVVRNHVYQIDVKSIMGYGSPVYIGTSNIVTPPEYPIEDESSYVAARINVLSWKIVKQEVNVGQ